MEENVNDAAEGQNVQGEGADMPPNADTVHPLMDTIENAMRYSGAAAPASGGESAPAGAQGQASDGLQDGASLSDFDPLSVDFSQGPQKDPDAGSASESAAAGAFNSSPAAEPEVGGPDGVKFTPSDKPADGASKSAPPVLNKKRILYIVFGAFILLIVFAMFFPKDFKKKQAAKQKDSASSVQLEDFESMVPHKAGDAGVASGQDGAIPPVTPPDSLSGKKDGDEIPPIVPPEKERNTSPSSVTRSGGGSTRPNTLNDRMQSKSISGIKGISGTSKYTASSQAAVQQPKAGVASVSSTNKYAQFGAPTKEQALASAYSSASMSSNSYSSQNDQSGKQTFHSSGSGEGGAGEFLPDNSIYSGTIFPAVLLTAVNTDLPGECEARISRNIYSSLDGRYLLIPQNSILLGSYNSSISYSQKRVQVAWYTLIRPDGYKVSLGNFNGADSQGAAGVQGWINDHPLDYLKAVGIMSVFNIISSEFTNQISASTNDYVQNILSNSQEVATTLGDKLIDRAMDVQPTINIRAGTRINIFANQDLTLPPVEQLPDAGPYHKY